MRLFVGVLILMCSLPLWANTTLTTQVYDLDMGAQMDEETLVFLSGGQVARINLQDREMLDQLHEAKENKTWLQLTYNENNEVISASEIASPIEAHRPSGMKSLMSFTPSVIDSPEAALLIFKAARINPKDSQCFNRAQIWTYEWRANNNLFTSKIWLFFTRKYIRKFAFKWWFHVAPYLHVMEAGQVYERVADLKYGKKGPMKVQQWTNIFLSNDSECPVVTSYSEQANYPETGWCYVMKSSMYYYQPIDLEVLDKDGKERNHWNPSEVRQAYKEAYDIDV
ncbi:MAG TPA: protein-glutamine glutaminase family protein [Bacteriovoracaceae bacterium]|nr:protein-glutamine glutaminase family protein [Bacteriovoracaceae bacterium]